MEDPANDKSDCRLEQQLRTIIAHIERLLELSRSQVRKSSGKGSFAKMVTWFAWTQEEHAEAVLRLGRHRDVELIARSMIEGLCQIKWAAAEPETKAQMWLEFFSVYNWRRLQRNIKSGLDMPQADVARVQKDVERYGEKFKTPTARKKQRQGKQVQDPYQRHWSGKGVAELCEKVEGQDLYEWGYRTFSDWHHWSPGGMSKTLRTSGQTISYTKVGAGDVFSAHHVAFQCLYEVLELANEELDLGMGDQLTEIRDSYIQEMSEVTE